MAEISQVTMPSDECHWTLLIGCCQATSHYLSQYWHRSTWPYGITRPLCWFPWMLTKNQILLNDGGQSRPIYRFLCYDYFVFISGVSLWIFNHICILQLTTQLSHMWLMIWSLLIFMLNSMWNLSIVDHFKRNARAFDTKLINDIHDKYF